MTVSVEQDPTQPPQRKDSLVTYGVIILVIWLGWEVVKAPVAQRAPPEIAVRVAPYSAEVLSRAADEELAAKRKDNAAVVARAALERAPFNAQALRVLGLSIADTRPDDAERIMTLAGNLSLRDNATHGWLVEQRLRRGDYRSAFAHADTLVRRRIELGPQIFKLYTFAANRDPRALPALLQLLSTRPRWRQDYLEYLYADEDGAQLLASLVVLLEPSNGRFSDAELRQLYNVWRSQKRIPGMRAIREALKRPPVRPYVQNGDFEQPEAKQLPPFSWMMGLGAGIAAAITDSGDGDRGQALWIDYDGFASGMLAEQLVTLPAGPFTVTGAWRADGGGAQARLSWQVVCLGTERTLVSTSNLALTDKWSRFSFSGEIPAEFCDVQALRLVGVPGDFRRQVSVWVDDVVAASGEA